MLWWMGAVVVGLMSVACGLNLGSRVSRGAENIWQPAIFGWAVGFHGAAGLLALWMITKTIG
jgi:hypothetical protein